MGNSVSLSIPICRPQSVVRFRPNRVLTPIRQALQLPMSEYYKDVSELRNISGAKTVVGVQILITPYVCLNRNLWAQSMMQCNCFSFGVMYYTCEGDVVKSMIFHSHALKTCFGFTYELADMIKMKCNPS